MFYTYVLQSMQDKDIYIGYTNNLKRRLLEHNRGLNFFYQKWKTLEIDLLGDFCLNDNDAKRRERYFKTSRGRLLKKQT